MFSGTSGSPASGGLADVTSSQSPVTVDSLDRQFDTCEGLTDEAIGRVSSDLTHADWISDDAVLPTAVDELHCDSHIGYETEPDSHLRQCYAIT
ncbi:MAG: hypothetical protein QOD96_7515 [Pseudonocardiales bacterium]|nr:hypothetical protein [Pseudonocardiales bacterium]